MVINRRKFLGCMATFAYTGIEAAATELFGKYRDTANEQPYTVVEGVSRSDIEPLKEVLGKPTELRYGSSGEALVEIRGPQPGICYRLMGERSEHDPSHTTLSTNSKGRKGNVLLFTGNGFFLTANHLVNGVEESSENDGNGAVKVLLVYDPVSGFASDGRVLAFSKKYDIALGKVDIPKGFNLEIPKLAVAGSDSPVLDKVYTMTYESPYAASGLLNDIIQHGFYICDINRPFKKNPDTDLGMAVRLGNMAIVKDARVPDWESIFTSKVIGGDSGSAVFDLPGNIAGVVTGSRAVRRNYGAEANSTGEVVNATVFTNPSKVRGLLEAFLKENGSRGL